MNIWRLEICGFPKDNDMTDERIPTATQNIFIKSIIYEHFERCLYTLGDNTVSRW